jgi:hypothetical protein
MISYLEKYQQLPLEIRQKFSLPESVAAIKKLEDAYNVDLGVFVIKVLVDEIKLDQGAVWLSRNFKLEPNQANALMLELKSKVFAATPEIVRPTEAKSTLIETKPAEILDDLATDDIEVKMEKIVEQAKVNFASQELLNRFKKIILTHLKGIRDKINTKEALTKPVENGGLGFDVNSAENILRLAANQEIVGEIKNPNETKETARGEIVKTFARDVEYDLASAIKAKREAGTLKSIEQAPAEEKLLAPPTPMVEAQPQKIKQRVKLEPAFPASTPVSRAKNQVSNLRKTETGKVKMDDIIGSPRVFTPVDEIKYMTVKNFRNLDPDPNKAIEVIKKKIEALAAEDYSKKIAGIQGWKTSPVNRMYVEAYQDAINEGKEVVFILNKKIKNNPEFINEAEFEAILKLNQDLKAMIH